MESVRDLPPLRKSTVWSGPSCGTCPIRSNAVCSLCNREEFELLEQIKSYRTFRPGEKIATAGHSIEYVASVVSGIAVIRQDHPDGRRSILGFLFPSDFLGRPGREQYPFDIDANSEVCLCCFRRKDFDAILRRCLSINRRLLEMTLDELDAARMWMSVLGRTNSRERISSLLILILEHQSRLNRTPVGEAADFSLPITREEAADFLGLTLETVSRRLSDLKSEGIIEFGGVRRIHIPCLESLLSETGDPAVWRDRLSRANA